MGYNSVVFDYPLFSDVIFERCYVLVRITNCSPHCALIFFTDLLTIFRQQALQSCPPSKMFSLGWETLFLQLS